MSTRLIPISIHRIKAWACEALCGFILRFSFSLVTFNRNSRKAVVMSYLDSERRSQPGSAAEIMGGKAVSLGTNLASANTELRWKCSLE